MDFAGRLLCKAVTVFTLLLASRCVYIIDDVPKLDNHVDVSRPHLY